MRLDTSVFEHYSFDLWLTLIKSNPAFKQKRNMLLRDFFGIDRKIEDIDKVVRHYDVLTNRISELTGKHVHRDHIYYLILGDLGLELDDRKNERLSEFKIEVDSLFMNYKPVLLDRDIKNVFESIVSQDKSISLLSNTAFLEGAALRKLMEYYELAHFFSFQLYSDEMGVAKPNPAAFERVYQELTKLRGVQRKDVVHIGDNRKADFDGATSYGFNAILMQ